MVQIFPASVVNLWNEWDVRVLVLTSLCLQILLIVFGNRRKYIARNWIRIVTWMSYLSADWVATVALGMISNFQGEDVVEQNPPNPNNNLIMAFWAPFLLVHLGGPDTITAYSMEDNELWLRHLLGLTAQVGVVSYILIWIASTYHLLLLIPVFVAGTIKYAERTWVLRSASTKMFSESLLPPPNPGNSYAEVAEKYSILKARGEGFGFWSTGTEGTSTSQVYPAIPEAKTLHEAFALFKIFKRLYANLILDYHERQLCYDMIGDHSAEDVFKQIEIELGFMYDVLYTKAMAVYSLKGVIFRSISLFCYISTFLVFCFVIDKKLFSSIDITLTYLLSLGAIVLEMYAIMILVSTDWSLYWLSKQTHKVAYPIYRAISYARSNYLGTDKKWSESMAEFNLIEFCIKEKPLKFAGIQRALGVYEIMENYRYTNSRDVPIKLKQLIFKQIIRANEQEDDTQVILARRGNHELQKRNCIDKFRWSVVEATFEKSILLWHIATDLCFYSDHDKYDHQGSCSNLESELMISKLLADYMMYILAMRHFMLPKGIGQIRFRDTCAEATIFFEKRRSVISNGKSHSRQALLSVNTELDPQKIHGDRTKTVLFEGCRLAKQLNLLETEEGWSNEEKWEMISQVWIEILCYAASQCGWKEHGQQLRRGGELLTHVCLLMANLGLSEQFQIIQGSPTVGIN